MSDAFEHWTEAHLRALSTDEYDFQEFKASPYLGDVSGVAQHFRDKISKQLSAFANGAGKHIKYGCTRDAPSNNVNE